MVRKLEIEGVDYSSLLIAIDAEPTDPGVVATATIHLAEFAGGHDFQTGMEVKAWESFDSSGAGVAAQGRYFGGIIANQDDGNIGATKTYTLDCQGYNILQDKIVREGDVEDTLDFLHLASAQFPAMILDVVTQLQKSFAGALPAEQIDATTYVVDPHILMPAMVLDAGKSLGYYLRKVCDKANELTGNTIHLIPDIKTQTTFGVSDSFGGAALHVYDTLQYASPRYHFSDTPTGAQKIIYPEFRRLKEHSQIVNRRQMSYHTDAGTRGYITYADLTSQTTYPNKWVNHARAGNKGFWMDEVVIDDGVATNADAAQRLRLMVAPKANPRETVEFMTPEPINIGDVVLVTWSLEDLTAASYRVVGILWDFSDPLTTWSHLTLGNRVLEYGENGEDINGPIDENNNGVPHPPGLSLISNTITDPYSGNATLVLRITPSPSPTALFYRLYNYLNLYLLADNITITGAYTDVSVSWAQGQAFSIGARAVGSNGYQSGFSTLVTGTAATLVVAPPTSLALDTTVVNPTLGYGWAPDGGYMGVKWSYSGPFAPDRFDVEFYNGTEVHQFIVDGTERSAFMNGLQAIPGTWHARVRAVIFATVSIWATLAFTFPAEDVAEPTGLAVNANIYDISRGETHVQLTYSPGSGGGGGGAITPIDHYRVDVANSFRAYTQEVPFGTNNAWFYLPSNRAHTAQVTAVNTNGNESDTVPATPLAFTTSSEIADPTIKNPGFEEENPFIPGQPRWWTSTLVGTGSTQTRSTDAYDGNYSLHLHSGATLGWYAQSTSAPITVLPGINYRLYVAKKFVAFTTPTFYATILCYDVSGGALTSQNVSFAPTPSWSVVNGPFTTPANTAYIRIQFQTDSLGAQVNDLYLDAVRIIQEATTSDYGDALLAPNGGTTSGTVVQANDTRMSDSRTPTAHQSSHQSGGSDALTGNVDAVARNGVRANSGGSTYNRRRHNLIATAPLTVAVADDAINEEVDVTLDVGAASTVAAGVVILAPNGGTGVKTAVQGNDSRLNDSRTPLTHKASHVSGGSDAFASTDNLDAVARVGTRVNSTGSTFNRRRVNFIPTSPITIAQADDSVNEEVDVTFDHATSGVSAGTYKRPGTVVIDSRGHITSASDRSGTAFPGSPSSGDTFFRTDLGVECYWNGTYWVTTHLYEQVWNPVSSPITYTTTQVPLYSWTPPASAAFYFEHLTWRFITRGTNNGLSYWRLGWQQFNWGLGGGSVDYKNTSGYATNTVAEEVLTAAQFTGNGGSWASANNYLAWMRIDKVGSPTQLDFAGVTLGFRRIYT